LTFPLGCLLQPQKKIKTRNEKKRILEKRQGKGYRKTGTAHLAKRKQEKKVRTT